MLAEATRMRARERDQIASQGGRGIAQLRSAKMGSIPNYPSALAADELEGVNDTSSPEKTITAVVTASFSMD
jgi:hypothetical protein